LRAEGVDTIEALRLTGERTLPGIEVENYWFRRHEAVYLALAPHCAGARVLEAGCGEGYGAALLAGRARQVVALDYDAAAIGHAAGAYPAVRAVRANLVALPFPAASFDVVCSLQVIEHLWEQPRFVAECARVLRPGGRLLLSTPNRLTFSPGRDTPLNPFHTREFTAVELAELLSGFGTVTLLGVRHGAALLDADARHGSLVAAQLAAPAADWPAALRADVARVGAADFVLSDVDIDSSLDLVAVAELPR
jgi:SAM-dependent methyltransferase